MGRSESKAEVRKPSYYYQQQCLQANDQGVVGEQNRDHEYHAERKSLALGKVELVLKMTGSANLHDVQCRQGEKSRKEDLDMAWLKLHVTGLKHLHRLGKHAGKVLQHGSRGPGAAANVAAPVLEFAGGNATSR